jgi:hypothetical protein
VDWPLQTSRAREGGRGERPVISSIATASDSPAPKDLPLRMAAVSSQISRFRLLPQVA